MSKKLTKKDKVSIISNSPDVINAVRILTALMDDAKIKNYVQYDYQINGEMYRLRFDKLNQEGGEK